MTHILLSSNWEALRPKLGTTSQVTEKQPSKRRRSVSGVSRRGKRVPDEQGLESGHPYVKRRRTDMSSTAIPPTTSAKGVSTNFSVMLEGLLSRQDDTNRGLNSQVQPGAYVAMDCEMVGYGSCPEKDSQLARASMVDYNGNLLYDSYVLPQEPVTDYRTPISGITPALLAPCSARPFSEVQTSINELMEGRVLVGHALKNDLTVLRLGHPQRDIRDTSRLPEYRRISMGKAPSLKRLTHQVLGLNIQEGSHSSIEDARAAMALFRKSKDSFDKDNLKRFGRPRVIPKPIEQQLDSTLDPEADHAQVPQKKDRKKKKKKTGKK